MTFQLTRPIRAHAGTITHRERRLRKVLSRSQGKASPALETPLKWAFSTRPLSDIIAVVQRHLTRKTDHGHVRTRVAGSHPSKATRVNLLSPLGSGKAAVINTQRTSQLAQAVQGDTQSGQEREVGTSLSLSVNEASELQTIGKAARVKQPLPCGLQQQGRTNETDQTHDYSRSNPTSDRADDDGQAGHYQEFQNVYDRRSGQDTASTVQDINTILHLPYGREVSLPIRGRCTSSSGRDGHSSCRRASTIQRLHESEGPVVEGALVSGTPASFAESANATASGPKSQKLSTDTTNSAESSTNPSHSATKAPSWKVQGGDETRSLTSVLNLDWRLKVDGAEASETTGDTFK